MKYPFFWMAAGFATGILLSFWIPLSDSWIWSIFVITLPFLWKLRAQKGFLPFFFLALACLGFLYTSYEGQEKFYAIENFSGQGSLQGVIQSEVQVQERGRRKRVSFILESESFKNRNQNEIWQTRGKVQVFLFNPGALPRYGDTVRVFGKLAKTKPPLNPGEFDYQNYLKQKKIQVTFMGFGARSLRMMRLDPGHSFKAQVEKTRSSLALRIAELFGAQNSNASLIFQALILGKRTGLSRELKENFMKTGTAHLLAISGLHVSLISGAFYFLFLALRFKRWLACLFSLFVLLGYVLISGSGIPAQRAGWMLAMGFLGMMLKREHQPLNFFFLAFFLLILFDPRALQSISFQLSFLSVFSLILFLRKKDEIWSWAECVHISVAVIVGTLPLILATFHVFSLWSVVSNLVAVPLFHLALLFAFAAFVPVLGALFVAPATFFLSLGVYWIDWLAGFDWGYVFCPEPSWIQWVLYYACVLGSFFWRKAVIFPLWLALTLSFFVRYSNADFGLTLLSAGQNEVAHLEIAPGEHWLVNTGRAFPSNQAEWILTPYLRKQAVKTLEGIVITDARKKHWGGKHSLERNFSWKRWVDGKSVYKKTVIVQKEKSLFQVLGVGKQALVLHMRYKDWDFLFLPNLSSEILEVLEFEEALLDQIEVLILPAKKEFDDERLEILFDSIDPDVATVPVSNQKLESFLAERDIPLLDLKELGAIQFLFKKQNPNIEISSFLKGDLRFKSLMGIR